jgi:hypothetical protein
MSFDNVGLIELEDAESGEVFMIDTASKQFRREFSARANEDMLSMKKSFQLINLDFINVRTDQSYIVPLINFFKMRGKRL